MPKPKITDADGLAAVRAWHTKHPTRAQLATAVRYTLQLLAERAPGNSVEVRVPPFGAVQCLPGPGHTRGTPPNVIETDAETWLQLATGRLAWGSAAGSAAVRASGTRATLAQLLPLLAADEVRE